MSGYAAKRALSASTTNNTHATRHSPVCELHRMANVAKEKGEGMCVCLTFLLHCVVAGLHVSFDTLLPLPVLLNAASDGG